MDDAKADPVMAVKDLLDTYEGREKAESASRIRANESIAAGNARIAADADSSIAARAVQMALDAERMALYKSEIAAAAMFRGHAFAMLERIAIALEGLR